MVQSLASLPTPGEDEVLFVSLGGMGAIGMNLSLYGCCGEWLGVDLGVGFGDETMAGIDLLVPNMVALEDQLPNLRGFVFTHGHEDHIGAVPYLWQQLRCPLWACPLTATLIANKLRDAGLQKQVPLHVVETDEHFSVGCFGVQMLEMTHSIPQSCALGIETPVGRVLHSGDWYFDPHGDHKKKQALQRFASDEGVMALFCDSTNVLSEKTEKSEHDLRESFISLLAGFDRGIAMTFFASNAFRLESAARAALANDRSPILVGRSMHRYYDAARRNGCIEDLPFLSEEEGRGLEPEKAVYLCTGSQGEPRAVMSRLAVAGHPHVSLSEGDVAIFSSRVIPGNEKAVARVYNGLLAQDIQLVTSDDAFVHVSGHATRADLRALYQLVSPRFVVPIHGETQHLQLHRQFASACGYTVPALMHDGDVLRLTSTDISLLGTVQHGYLGVYGRYVLSLQDALFAARQRVYSDGMITITIVLQQSGALAADIVFSAATVFSEQDDVLQERLERALVATIESESLTHRQDDDYVKQVIVNCARKHIKKCLGVKPLIEVLVIRV